MNKDTILPPGTIIEAVTSNEYIYEPFTEKLISAIGHRIPVGTRFEIAESSSIGTVHMRPIIEDTVVPVQHYGRDYLIFTGITTKNSNFKIVSIPT